MNPARIELSPEEMRRLGYTIVDRIVEHMRTLPDQRVTGRSGRTQLDAILAETPPEHPSGLASVLETLDQHVFRNMAHVSHPRFFGWVPAPGNFVGVMADALAAAYNVFQGTWLASSGPSAVELTTLDWLRQICGLPESAEGICVSGGSIANLTALAVARHARLQDRIDNAVVYFSDQTHSSVERALRVLGFSSAQLRKLASDAGYRLATADLARAVSDDRTAGRVPFCVIANAGTTNTGAVDPLNELADFCRDQKLWLHADGAYGAAAVLCDRGRTLLAGLERVDSLVLDPHKWLFQPIEIGCLLVRDGSLLRDTFRIMPEYLQDAHSLREEVHFCDRGIELTRGFRALKLWMSIKLFGLAAFRAAIEHGFVLAELAEARLRQWPLWEVTTPAQMAIVSFRYNPPGHSEAGKDRLNQKLVHAMFDDGFALPSSTVLRGRTVLRLCPINPRTTAADITDTIDRLEKLATQLG